MFLLVSCTSVIQESSALFPKLGEKIEITAYSDGTSQTKTGIVDKEGGGKSVVWKAGDSMSLFFISGENGGNKFTTNTDGPIAKFTGSITAVSGEFEAGHTVSVKDESGNELARGLSHYSSRELEKIKGHKSSEIEKILGEKTYDEVIHRDDLVIL